MDRSPEKSALLSTKAHSLEAKTAGARQQFVHEAVTTNAIFRPLKKAFPSQSTLENSSKTASFSGSDVGIGRNSEQFISSLQAQYYSPNVPSAALAGMTLPFGMIPGPGMDPRALNARNLLYPYGNPNFIPDYGQAQRVKNGEETAPPSDKTFAASTQLRPTESASRPSKEPMRTESVIKTVTDKQEISRKPSDPDKRILTDAQSSNIPLKYPGKGTGNELGNSVEGKTCLSLRDMQLRDSQSAEDMSRRDKQSIGGDFDRSRDMPTKMKPYEHLGVDPVGIKRSTNGLTSRTAENGAATFSSYNKNYISSESRSSPYPATEPPTLVPYHSTPPLRTSASTSHSTVPSTMPKLTPIAPRISNGSPLTVSYSSEADHRKSPSFGTRRQNYPNAINPASSAPSGTVHCGGIPWTVNYPSRPPQGDKMDENLRTKQNRREERDLNRTSVYDQGPKQQFARNFYPVQPWEGTPYGALPPQFRAVGADKSFGGKDDDNVDAREVSRDSSSDGMSSEQSQAKLAKIGYKYGAGPVSVRKESDLPNAKIATSASPDEYQRNQPFAGRNEKSVVGEYVSYNKNDDVKGSLGSTVVHGKEGSFRLSVERREGNKGKYLKQEITKPSRTEEHRVTSSSYSNYDGREPGDVSYMSMSRVEARSARDDKAEKDGDRTRPLEPSRAKDQVLYKDHAGRKLDPREVSTLNDGKKSNDRNNNSTQLTAFPFFKYGAGGFSTASHGEQMRFVERGAASDDKVFVPPNATIDMYERREQEMEKNTFKRNDLSVFSRNVEGSHSSNPNDEGSKRIDERRGVPRRDEAKSKMPPGRFENDKRGGDAEEISSDENDDGARHGSGETISADKRVQHRVAQSSDRTAVSPAAGAVRQRRLSSPLSEQRSAPAERRNPAAPNAYGALYGPSLQSRRIPSDGSEGHSRESGVESGLEGVGNPGPAQFLRMDGGAFPSPYFGQLLTPQGLSETPLLFVDPASFYGAMYRPHMMEAAPQGMFPSGAALTADPVTGQIVMIPEAYIPMVAAENAFMNPMMDPRFHGMWGMPGAIDEAQWQQFYQMMQPFQQQQQQQQHKQQQQLLERSKQELLLGKQGAPFPFHGYPFYYGDKRFEQQRKEEVQDVKSSEQQQKTREVKQEASESQSKETATRPKPETTANQEHVQRLPASRDIEFAQQQETPNQREDKPKTDSRSLKEAHQKLTEKQDAVLAKLDMQGQMVKQFKDYLSLDPLSQFPYPGPPTSFLRDTPMVNLTAPTTTTSAPTPQVDTKSVSPKTVSAAVTLSSLEKARAQEPHWTGKVSPPLHSDPRVVSSQNSVVERVKSPRVRSWAESTVPKEIVETPRRLVTQPNLVGERLVSRESRDPPVAHVPVAFPQKLMAFGNIASERLLEEKSQRELERDRFEASLRAYEREHTVSTKGMSRSGSEKVPAETFEGYLPRREHSQVVETFGQMVNSFVNSEIERSEKGLQPLQQVELRGSMESQEDLRGSLQTLTSSETLAPSQQIESDSEFGDDFRAECELRRIASSFVPLKPDLENKENSAMFSLRPFRSEAERKQIRDNIDRLRSMAKRRNSKERFKVFSRRRDLRSPTTILNGVTSAIGDVAGVESVEKEMRMKLAELQKRYREKVRELARLQPKYGGDDGNGKSTPIKRGPGRPPKRKYFGASSKGEKSSPVATADEDKEGTDSLSASGAQSPELSAVASESESQISKESEPPKKKRKRPKQKNTAEQEGRGTVTPTFVMNPVELAVPSVKKKKVRKPYPAEEEPTVTISKSKPMNGKKKAAGTGKQRKEDAVEEQDTTKPQLSVTVETSTKELESDPDFMEPGIGSKSTKTKKPKPKKRARPKLTIDNGEGYDGKEDDEMPLDNASETPQSPTPTKSKKTKISKKKRKTTVTTITPKEKFQFPEVTSQDESFSENSSISPNEIAKEVVATAARKQLEAQKNSREMPSDNEDDVFSPSHDGRDGLSLLAQASFATTEKSTKRKRSELAPLSEDLSLKKRGRPKKDNESPLFEQDTPVTPPKKKKKKKVQEEGSTKEPKKKKKKKKKDAAPKEELTEEKPMEVQQEDQTEVPHPPPCEEHEDLKPKKPETSAVNDDSEQDEDVFPVASEVSKEARTSHSSVSIQQDGGDSKTSISSLLSDEWQPRRSERIFINSSVTTISSLSPISPSGKGSEFSYTKKPKKGSGAKAKTSRSGSQGEEELVESDVIVPQKVKSKAKKKRGPGKAKKRLPSDEDYEPLKVSRRVRSKSRLTIDYDDADEDDADELQENEEPREEGETDVEINVTDKVETAEEKPEDKALPLEDKKETDLKPEAEESNAETEVKADQQDIEMEVDKKVEAKNDGDETGKTATVEESKEEERTEDVAKQEEKTEKDQPPHERPSSPVDARFMFLVGELVEGSKLLLPVDSVFYPGRISTFNEPDLFGVVLDGERGRRPHWKSTEQLLTDAVKDIQPPSDKFLTIGTRVCAHWSPQYRCFYPGTVTEAPPDEKEVDGKIWIEFDDGDSGFFQLNEIRRIQPDFPAEEVESTPSLPEKRPRSSSLGATATKDTSSRLRAEGNTSEFSSGNESSGEIQSRRRRLRGKRKSRDDSWLPSKQMNNGDRERAAKRAETVRNKPKEVVKSATEDTGSLTKVRDKSNDSQENKVSDAQTKQKSSKTRGKAEANVDSKESSKTAENAKNDLASNASAELKESEKQIHCSDSSLKTEVCENNSKQSTDKMRASALETSTESDQGEDSETNSDVDTSKNERGTRSSGKGPSRTSEKDLRRRSLTLNLNSSFRSSRTDGESPTRDVVSTSQDEDSESYSDAFDESPLVENKSFQPRLGRRRRSELDRLQVDMKFSGPLWQWSGRNFQNKRKGKGKKVFYKAIVRGDETISVGDCAVFTSNPTKHLNLPYVGKIENMWEGCGGNMVVRVKWFYHPEETKPGRKPSDGKQSLYRSTHVDENDVQTISHKCEVLSPEDFKRRFQNLESPGTRTSLSDRVFCCIGSYDPNNETLQTEL